MKPYWSESLRGLDPYVPGEQTADPRVLKLNKNENACPPSPAVLAALRDAVNADLRLYPDPDGASLKQAIAGLHGLTPAHVFVGNGSDEVLSHAFRALLKHDRPVLFPDISYSFYPAYCALHGIAYELVPLDDGFRVDLAGYARPNGGIVLPNPNAPTGIAVGLEAIRTLLAQSPGSVLVVDEAYVDFGAETAVTLVKDHPNLLVVQTFSKSRSLAGLRVGFAIGDPGLVEALNVVKGCFNSYPLDRLALVGAEAAIRDTAYFEAARREVITLRDRLAVDLQGLGFEVLPSSTNFVFARHPTRAAADLRQQLRLKNILVRHFDKPRIGNFLRITIGTEPECRELVRCLGGILGGTP